MPKFRAGGREWSVRLTYGLVARLRTEARFNISSEIKDSNFLEALLLDHQRLAQAMWVVCQAEAAAAGLTQDQFFDPIGGDEIEAFVAAFVEAVVDFSHPSKARAAAVKANLPGLIETANGKIGEALAAGIREADDRLKTSTWSGPGGNSPGSSELTQPT